MNTPKFTQAPWEVVEHPSVGVFVRAPESIIKNPHGPDYAVEILGEDGYGNHESNRIHDARLVSAAPKLFKALKDIIDAAAVCDTDDNIGLADVYTPEMEAAAIQALQQAVGG